MVSVIVFGFDSTEASQIRRIRSFLGSGFDVRSFSMRRQNMNAGFRPSWTHVDLGLVANEDLLGRVLGLCRGASKALRNRKLMLNGDVIVARNLDLLAIAAIARIGLPQPRPPLAYECLDIHGAMTRRGWVGHVFRAVERRLLKSCSAIIVSSPRFVEAYFAPVQNWEGPVVLLENKLWSDAPLPRPDPASAFARPASGPLRVGWVGTLRCARSLDLLEQTARLMGGKSKIVLHGVVHEHAIPDWHARVSANPYLEYKGPYDYPDDLSRVYDDCDLVWSQDLWQWGANSTWLLPNRIYEASYFGCPSVAAVKTETGRRISDQNLGWVIPEPDPAAFADFLMSLSSDALLKKRHDLLSAPAGDFRLHPDEVRSAVNTVLKAGGRV